MQLTKIISGGQTGADQAGLYAGRDLGLKTGGCMPKGFRTQSGPNPELAREFGLNEHSSSSYPPRTEVNIINSDATLIFGYIGSAGCKLTRILCIRHSRNYKHVFWDSNIKYGSQSYKELKKSFADWIHDNPITVLNVAGNREESQPGIFDACRKFIVEAIHEYT
jgi:hypothetical protein